MNNKKIDIEKLNQDFFNDPEIQQIINEEKQSKQTKKIDIEKLNKDLKNDLKKYKLNEKNIKKVVRSSGYKSKKINKYMNKIIGSYDPEIRYIKNLRYAGKDIIAIKIQKKMKINKIQELGNSLSAYLQKKDVNGIIMCTMYYGNMSWRSGYFTDIGENVDLFDPTKYYDNADNVIPNYIDSFYFFIKLGKKEGGTNDIYNDCLYNSIKYFIFDIEKYFGSQADFKKFLGLKRNSKISIDLIDKIEKKLKTYQINIMGDYIRESKIISNKRININLSNEHYSPIKKPIKKDFMIKYEDKEMILYDIKTFEGYDGINKWILTKQEKSDILFNPKNKYILINRSEQRDENKNKIKISIEEEYIIEKGIIDELKTNSKGLINLYKTGSYVRAGLDLFDRLTKYLDEPEPILYDEALWIKKATRKQLINSVPYEGKIWEYDIVSMFPYLMTSYNNRFPIARGDFKQIQILPEILEFGIYRCEIKPSNDEQTNLLFSYNTHNYYTHLDIYNARKLQLEIKLIIEENKINCLYYTNEKLIKYGDVFNKYVEYLFELKKNGTKGAKIVLNRLWGALGEINKKKSYITDTFDIPDNEIIDDIYECGDGFIFKTVETCNIYKRNYARCVPWLLSKSRTYISDMLIQHKDKVKRILTDGIFLTEPIFPLENKKNLGELKFIKNYDYCVIKNKTNGLIDMDKL